jgi:hypothetical protein
MSTLFDLDISMAPDAVTGDLTDLYNEEAVNQSIDLWISSSYRVERGNTSGVGNYLFTDLDNKSNEIIKQEIQQEFEDNFSIINVDDLQVESDTQTRKIKINISWSLKNINISGEYSRYWNQK